MTLSRRTRVSTAHQCAQTAPAGWKRTSEVDQQRKRKKVGGVFTDLWHFLCLYWMFFVFFFKDDRGPWNPPRNELYYMKCHEFQMSATSCFQLVVVCPLLSLSVSLSSGRWGRWWLWDRSSGLLWGVSAGRGDHPVWHMPQSISPSVSGAWAGESSWGQVELPTLRESPS